MSSDTRSYPRRVPTDAGEIEFATLKKEARSRLAALKD